MRKTGNLLRLVFVVAAIGSSCYRDENKKFSYCDKQTSFKVENEIGRIYFQNVLGDGFYYIGAPDSVSRVYARIPCQVLDKNLISTSEVGLLVVYSGIITLPFEYPPGVDPLFVGIDLTQIEKAD
jgi:hypothetical protein